MPSPYLQIEMLLWMLHPLELNVPEEGYMESLNTCIFLLEHIEEEDAHRLSVQLPLWVKEGDKKSVYDVLSRLVEKEIYTSTGD